MPFRGAFEESTYICASFKQIDTRVLIIMIVSTSMHGLSVEQGGHAVQSAQRVSKRERDSFVIIM